MGQKWDRWGKDEIAIVRDNFECTLWKDLLPLLPNRSQQYIRKLGRDMGLTRKVEHIDSDETKLKVGDSKRGNHYFKDKEHTEATKLKMRISQLRRYGYDEDSIAKKVGKSKDEIVRICGKRQGMEVRK